MDADYYYATGVQLAKGEGFTEPFLWNYLDAPEGIPHPSHGYWLPLASLLAASGMVLTSHMGFSSAKIGFIFLAGLIPPLTAGMAYSLTRKRHTGILAGLLAAFSVYYLPYLPTTDSFGVYMLLGGSFFILPSLDVGSNAKNVLYGLVAGLMYLARADALIWLFVALGMTFYHSRKRPSSNVQRSTLNAPRFTLPASRFAFVLIGFFTIVTPWLIRNQLAFGTPFSPGGTKALWFTGYDQLFAYPASEISFEHWWASGLVDILRVRLWALGQNLQTFIAVQGSVFLVPLILIGGWQLREEQRVTVGILAWLVTLLAMTLVFPFAGSRGGFFHSGAALQPLLWALAAVGLDGFVAWGNRVRGWQIVQARKVFSSALVGFTLLLTILIVGQRVIGWGENGQSWGDGFEYHRQLSAVLDELPISPEDTLMINNPPGFYLASGRPCIVIPDGDENTLLAAAERYGAEYVILEFNHPQGLNDLYENPEQFPALSLLWSDEYTYIFEIMTNP